MKLWLLISLAALAAWLPPIPQLPPRYHKPGGVSPKIVPAPVLVTNELHWIYPTSMASRYWWNVETSTDFTNWSVLVSNASGVTEVQISQNEALRAYRLMGRLQP